MKQVSTDTHIIGRFNNLKPFHTQQNYSLITLFSPAKIESPYTFSEDWRMAWPS